MSSIPKPIRDLPLVGRWATRLGRVVDIWGMPCNPTPEIWVTAAWRTIPRMLIMLIKPSAAETINSRFGRRHGRTPRFKLSSNVEVPGFGAVRPGTFTSVLFKLSQKGLVFLQYVQFIDVATEGLVQWSSMTYQYAGCLVPGGGGGQQQSTGSAVMLGSLSGSTITLATTVSHAQHCVGFAFTWACEASKSWSASYSINWKPLPEFPLASPQFELQDGAGNAIGEGSQGAPNPDGSIDAVGFFRVGAFGIGPKNFVVVYRSNFSFEITSASFSVAGGPTRDFLKPDP